MPQSIFNLVFSHPQFTLTTAIIAQKHTERGNTEVVAWLTRKADALEKARLDVDNESVEKARVGSIKATVDVPIGNVKEEL